VLRDDRPAPDAFDGTVRTGATLLVACLIEPDDADPVGVAVVRGSVPALTLDHLWVRPDARGQGLGRMIEELVRARSATRGATVLAAEVPSDNLAMAALARGTRVLGLSMARRVDAGAALPAGFGWRPMTAGEFGPWRERQVQAYAEDNLARSGGDVALALERSRADFARALPDGLDTADTSLVVLTAEDEPVGHLWLHHHRPGGETFGYDLEVDPAHRREGWGRAAIALADRLAHEAGDTVLGLHVFGDNVGARALYASVGFQVQSTKHDLLARNVP
jgi:ribosomal protein S18 acetylase RimI-like enzyme